MSDLDTNQPFDDDENEDHKSSDEENNQINDSSEENDLDESLEKQIEDDIEREELLSETEANLGEQIELSPDGEFKSVDDIKSTLLDEIDYENIDNPERKHELFYMIQRMINKNIEAGGLRDKINEEKRLFLNRGMSEGPDGRVGADSRQAYLSHLNIVLEMIIDWKIAHGSDYELYTTLYDHNEELNYH